MEHSLHLGLIWAEGGGSGGSSGLRGELVQLSDTLWVGRWSWCPPTATARGMPHQNRVLTILSPRHADGLNLVLAMWVGCLTPAPSAGQGEVVRLRLVCGTMVKE